MKAILLCVVLVMGFYTKAYTQDEVVLVKGNPPLTQLMVGKTIVLLDWVLDLKLSREQENQIGNVIQKAWKQNNKAQIKSTLDVIEMYDQVFRLNQTEQDKAKANLKTALVEKLKKEPKDELTDLVSSFYQSSGSAKSVTPENKDKKNYNPTKNTSAVSSKNSSRVGADGFTGYYRMVRPKALNINSTMHESGFYIEHIVFFPGGQLYRSLPPEGLLYFDYSLACRTDPRDCGTYEMKNNEIYVYLGPEKTKYIFTRNGERINNAPELGKGSFRPIPASDGLTLEGRYRRHETEPTITFTKDGKFTDGGAFKNFGTIGRLNGSTFYDDGIGGSGAYLIEQNTLELKYSEGRIKRFAFTAFPENLVDKPAIKSFLLYEQRLERY